mgnify:CR=1 FL=1
MGDQIIIPSEVVTLYKFLNPKDRFVYGMKILESKSIEELNKVSTEAYMELFSDMSEICRGMIMQISMIAGQTSSGDKVNIVMYGNSIFLNSDKLTPIKEIVKTFMIGGDILVPDSDHLSKNRNKNRYHMRFFRAYQRLNSIQVRNPIHLN